MTNDFSKVTIADVKILNSLLHDENYFNKTIGYLKAEHFEPYTKVVFKSISEIYAEYGFKPNLNDVKVRIEGQKNINEKEFTEIRKIVQEIQKESKDLPTTEYMIGETEYFIQKKMYTRGLHDLIAISSGDVKGSITKPMSVIESAEAFSFDCSVGDDFFADVGSLWDELHRVDARIPFGVTLLDGVTKGGMLRKSLSAFMATTGAGKSLAMCHVAASALLGGYNVLYVTLEMPSAKIRERTVANTLDIPLDDLVDLPKESFSNKLHSLQARTTGSLIVKEYSAGSIHAGHVKQLIKEVKQKRNIAIDLVIVDYVNLCASSRFNDVGNSYTYVKFIAEELRSVAVECDVAMLTATQANRQGYNNANIDLENTSQSMGLPDTLDFFASLYADEDMRKNDVILVKQLKNRWSDKDRKGKFILGIARAKMKLYDADQDYLEKIEEKPKGKKKVEPELSKDEAKKTFKDADTRLKFD